MIHFSRHHVIVFHRWRMGITLSSLIFSVACHALALTILATIPIITHHPVDRSASLQFEAGENAILLDINPIPALEIPELPTPSTTLDEPQRDLTAYLAPALVEDADDETPLEAKPTFTQNNDLASPPNRHQASRKTISRTINYAADRARFWSSHITELVQNLRDQIRTQQLEIASREISPDEGNRRARNQQTEIQLTKPQTANQPDTKTNTPLQPDSQNKIITAKPPSTSTASPGVQGPTVSVKVIKSPAPHYPPLSRRLNEEGLVVLKIQVHADGLVGKITVIEEPGYPRLVKEAISAVKKSTFQPALKNGKAVEDTIVLRFRFKLTDG